MCIGCPQWQGLDTASFDRSLTPASFGFEVLVVGATVLVVALLFRKYQQQVLSRFLIMMLGVLLFELFTAPMWNNEHLGLFGYVYRDVSWVLTLGWSTLLIAVILVVDHWLPAWRELPRFLMYLLLTLLVVIPFEAFLVAIGVRSYAPEVQAITGASSLFGTGVPWQMLYYVPVFVGLVIGFYKYWVFYITRVPLLPMRQSRWIRNFFLAFLAVFLFELMIEPTATNVDFPAWSYLYRDISIVFLSLWIVAIGIVTTLVDKFFQHYDLVKRFVLYVVLGMVVTWPVESYFIVSGMRQYSPSTVANYSGFTTPLTGVPVEIAFAIPLYLALVIAFIRYWGIVFDNKK